MTTHVPKMIIPSDMRNDLLFAVGFCLYILAYVILFAAALVGIGLLIWWLLGFII